MNKQDNLLKKDKLPWIAFLRAYTGHIQYVTKIIKMFYYNLLQYLEWKFLCDNLKQLMICDSSFV